MNNEVLIPNFFRVGSNGDKSVRKRDLGWSDSIKRDAQSDYPETIFRYIVEIVGLNILFYWTKDRQWYTIINGEPHTNSAGEILATFEEPCDIWNNLRINDVPIGKVLEESVITDLD